MSELPGHQVVIALRPKSKAGAISLKLGKLRLLKAEGLTNKQASRLFREAKTKRFGLENRVLRAAVNNDLSGVPRSRVKTVKVLQKTFGSILCDWYKAQHRD